MALFPAYAQADTESNASEKEPQASNDISDRWLCNDSYDVKSDENKAVLDEQNKAESSATKKRETVKKEPKEKSRKSKSGELHHKKHKKEKKQHHREKHEDQSKFDKERFIQEEIAKRSKDRVFIEQVGISAEHAFRIDRTADPNNLAFSTLGHKQTAKYWRAIPIWQCKKFWTEKPKSVKKEIEVNISSNITADDYFPLKRKRDSTIEEDDVKKDELLIKTAEFNSHLRENPKDEKLWLDYVQFQDESLQKFTKKKKDIAVANTAIFEKKLSIMDKALEHNPNSTSLILERMRILEHLREPTELRDEWKKLLSLHPANTELWRQQCVFATTKHSLYTLPFAVMTYQMCFDKLFQMQNPHFSSYQRPVNLERCLIDVVLDVCLLLKQSGHMERAIAISQALIEFNFFRPNSIRADVSVEDLKLYFEPFWDSGAARVGEKNANGWASVMNQTTKGSVWSNDRTVTDAEVHDLEDQELKRKCSTAEKWVSMETIREHLQWVPWRLNPENPTTEDECEDPARIVLYDDVEPFLYVLGDDESRMRAVLNLLILLEPSLSVGTHCFNYLLGSRFQTALESLSGISGEVPKILEVPPLLPQCSQCPHTSLSEPPIEFARRVVLQLSPLLIEPYRTSVLLLWLRCEIRLLQTLKNCAECVKQMKRFFKSVLKQGENRNNLLLFQEMALMEKELGDITTAVQVLQTALIARGKNPLDVVDSTQKAAIISVFRCLVELQMDVPNNKVAALQTLICLGSGQPLSSTHQSQAQLLRARQKFNTVDKELLGETEAKNVSANKTLFLLPNAPVDWLACHAYFEYLCADISEALAVLDRVLQTDLVPLSDNSSNVSVCDYAYHEGLYFASVKLLLQDLKLGSNILQTRRLLEPMIHKALLLFPQSGHFLSVALSLENCSSIASKLWRSLSMNLTKVQSVIMPLILCLTLAKKKINLEEELARGTELMNEAGPAIAPSGWNHKIQSILHIVSNNNDLRHCSLLWRLQLHLAHLDGKTDQCKSLFYLAIQSCPGVKALYVDMARYVPTDVETVVDMTTEKQLRVRLPLEELSALLEPVGGQNTTADDNSLETDTTHEENEMTSP